MKTSKLLLVSCSNTSSPEEIILVSIPEIENDKTGDKWVVVKELDEDKQVEEFINVMDAAVKTDVQNWIKTEEPVYSFELYFPKEHVSKYKGTLWIKPDGSSLVRKTTDEFFELPIEQTQNLLKLFKTE